MHAEENLVHLEKAALEDARRLVKSADAHEREVVELRATAATFVRQASRLSDDRDAQLAEARRLLDEGDALERKAGELRAEATLRVRQASRITSERQASTSHDGGRYAGVMRVADGTILPCGEFKFDGE